MRHEIPTNRGETPNKTASKRICWHFRRTLCFTHRRGLCRAFLFYFSLLSCGWYSRLIGRKMQNLRRDEIRIPKSKHFYSTFPSWPFSKSKVGERFAESEKYSKWKLTLAAASNELAIFKSKMRKQMCDEWLMKNHGEPSAVMAFNVVFPDANDNIRPKMLWKYLLLRVFVGDGRPESKIERTQSIASSRWLHFSQKSICCDSHVATDSSARRISRQRPLTQSFIP